MFRKNYYTFILAVALFLTGSVAAFAQSGMVRGTVMLKKADGTTAPLADVVIDVYRTDIKGRLPEAKTNKKGEFTILGFQFGARYALAVSAPNIAPDIFPEVKAGDERIMLTVVEGKGNRMTEDEARQILANVPKTAAAAVEMTAEQKKEQEELLRKNAEIEKQNKNVENINAITRKAVEEGNKAFSQGDFSTAVARYDEGINADPDFAPSAVIFLNNKATALVSRASSTYNAAAKADPVNFRNSLDPVKNDLNEAVVASNRTLALLKADTTTDPVVQKKYAVEKTRAYENLVKSYGRMLLMGIDFTKGKEAVAALNEYLALETNVEQKSAVQANLANALSRAGDLANAIPIFRRVLEVSPDNVDALGGLGLALVGQGSSETPMNMVVLQEGLNLMQRFSDSAPDTHPMKADVKAAVDYLKTQQLTPQKTTKPAKKKT